MKTRTTIAILIVTILLAACGAKDNSTAATQASPAGSTLPDLPRLVAGTFKLIDSNTPINSEEANHMVILWKAYLELQDRDTTHPQEVSDLLKQINNTLTIEQQAAVTAMNLTFSDVMALAREQGVDGNTTLTSSGSSGAATSGSRPAGMGNGGFQGGGGGMPPDMGGGGMPPEMAGGAAPVDAEAIQPSDEAGNMAAVGGMGENIALALIDPLIIQLETIAGSN